MARQHEGKLRGERWRHRVADLLAIDVMRCVSGSTKSSGKPMQRAASRIVIGRCSLGCR